MSLVCSANGPNIHNSATLQYRSISHSKLRPKYYTKSINSSKVFTTDRITLGKEQAPVPISKNKLWSLQFSKVSGSKTNVANHNHSKTNFFMLDLRFFLSVQVLSPPPKLDYLFKFQSFLIVL